MGYNEALEVFQNAQAALEVAAEEELDQLILKAFPTATAVEIRGDWSEGTASLTLSKVLDGEVVLWSEDGAVASGEWFDLYEIEENVLVTIGDLGADGYTAKTVRPVKRPETPKPPLMLVVGHHGGYSIPMTLLDGEGIEISRWVNDEEERVIPLVRVDTEGAHVWDADGFCRFVEPLR